MPLGTEVGLVPGDIVLDGDMPSESLTLVEPKMYGVHIGAT